LFPTLGFVRIVQDVEKPALKDRENQAETYKSVQGMSSENACPYKGLRTPTRE
jgi:hypothetical protein